MSRIRSAIVMVGVAVLVTGCGTTAAPRTSGQADSARPTAPACSSDPTSPSGWTDASSRATTDALRICLYASDVRRPIKTALIRGAAAAQWVNKVMAAAHGVASYDCNDNGDRTVLSFVSGGSPVSVVLGNTGCPSLDLSSEDPRVLVVSPALITSIDSLGGPGPLITVPDVVGDRLNAATSTVVKTGFRVDSAPYSGPHRQYVVVAQSPRAGARVYRTTVVLTLRALPRAPACTSAQVQIRLVPQSSDVPDALSYYLHVTNVSGRMCSVSGVPALEFWSESSAPLPVVVQRLPSGAAFDDISPLGTAQRWDRVASTSVSFRSGSSCGSSAVHPAFVTVTSGAIQARVKVAFPRTGLCPTGATLYGFDPE